MSSSAGIDERGGEWFALSREFFVSRPLHPEKSSGASGLEVVLVGPTHSKFALAKCQGHTQERESWLQNNVFNLAIKNFPRALSSATLRLVVYIFARGLFPQGNADSRRSTFHLPPACPCTRAHVTQFQASIMMSTQYAPHNPVTPGGGLSNESPPQVVVRAGKTYVCSACGTLVEIPADVVGQLIVVPAAAEREEEAASSIDRERPAPDKRESSVKPERLVKPESSVPAETRLLRPSRPQPPRPATSRRERIDELVVPTTKEMERLLAWIEYRLQQLRLLKQQEKQLTPKKRPQVPCCHPRRPAKPIPVRPRKGLMRRHAHADVGMAPELGDGNERGPP